MVSWEMEKGVYPERSQGKRVAGGEKMGGNLVEELGGPVVSAFVEIYRQFQHAGQNTHARDMVPVFVTDHDGFQAV